MAPVVSMINMKGGVAKTTLAVNTAFCAAKYHGMRVLLVDVDPQFNATQYLIGTESYLEIISDPKRCSIYHVFFEKSGNETSIVGPRKAAIPKPTEKNTTVNIWRGHPGKLDIIPSELRLMELDSIPRMKEKRLDSFLKKIGGAYDLVILDCPPTMTVFTLSAYLASSAYLVPLKPDPLSTIGLPLLEEAIAEYAADSGHHVESLGIVFTMVRKTRLMEETMLDMTRTRKDSIFKGRLSFGTEVAKSVERRKPLTEYSQARKFGDEIKQITEELIQRLGVQ